VSIELKNLASHVELAKTAASLCGNNEKFLPT